AVAVRVRAHRGRVPALEIEVSMLRPRRRVAPRVLALGALGRSVGGAMELRLGRQRALRPARERGGFGVAHVHRRLLGQRGFGEHPAQPPAAVALDPEARVTDALALYPRPVRIRPQGSGPVAAVPDELEEAPVRTLRGLD